MSLTINTDDFLIGVFADYLVSCQARLYNSQGTVFSQTSTLTTLNAFELNTTNGYERKTVSFSAPQVSTINNVRYLQVNGTEEIRWSAVGGNLGGTSVTHIALVARVDSTPRVVHLIAVNPQETSPGSGVFSAAPLGVTAGNALVFTPNLRLRDEVL